jgi:hypothetical protein
MSESQYKGMAQCHDAAMAQLHTKMHQHAMAIQNYATPVTANNCISSCIGNCFDDWKIGACWLVAGQLQG